MKWHRSGTFHRATAPHGHASVIQHKHKNWSATVTIYSIHFQTKKEATSWAECALSLTEDSANEAYKRMMET